MPGTLILCATPIGNLGDAPPRLGEALTSASVVYAEDTRRSRVLLRHLGVDRPLRSFFVGNEATRSEELAGRLQRGETVALVTDAGTPAVADPGFTAVRAAIEVGAEVTVVPGPSAVTAALAVSGLPTDRFVFEGFLPRSGKERRSRLESLAVESRTTILFAAAGRLVDDHAILAVTAPVHYRFEVEAQVAPYAGGGLALGLVERDRPRDDTDFEIALKAVGGAEWRLKNGNDFFVELNFVFGDLHDTQVLVGWTF